MSNNYELKNLCNDPTETPHEQPTFKTVCNGWIERKKIYCTISTIRSYELKLNKYLLKTPFADRLIGKIQREDIEKWVHELRKTCAEKCIYTNLGIVKNIFHYAIKMGWTENNPTIMFRLPKPKVKLPEPFKKDEVETILENIDPFYHDYQEVMFFTGMRITEINALKPSDIDLNNKIICIGRSSSDGQSHNYKNFRRHFMNERVFKAVSRQLNKAKKIGSMTLFYNERKKPIDSSYFWRMVWKPLFDKKTIMDAGIRYRPLRNCRYTYATLLCLEGVSITTIARQMGYHLKNLGI